MLKGKTIVLGVTGSIAAYKIANLASMLVKLHADVNVIMTRNACNFITPTTFETLTGHKCLVDTFDRNFEFQVEHVALAKRADIFRVAPATANIIGKMAHGICDDMLTTTLFATKAPVVVAPAMNTGMWENPILQDNLQILRKYGYHIILPDCGRLACGDTGSGKMPSEAVLLEHILLHVAKEKDMAGKRVLITAGPTREALDPVRFITNHSSGKMGYAIAREAMLRGADVTLVSGPTALPPVPGVRMVHTVSAQDMFEAVKEALPRTDILIKSAAVADYRPAEVSPDKIKKREGEMAIPLERTPEILTWVSKNRHPGLFVCGFSMETKDLLDSSRKKLEKKHLDMIVANNLKVAGAGFGVDTNVVTILTDREVLELPMMGKDQVAARLLDEIRKRRGE